MDYAADFISQIRFVRYQMTKEHTLIQWAWEDVKVPASKAARH
jgi:hypothetical protein